MQHHQEVCEMNQPRRGRPPTGIRKERLQVMLDPADHEALETQAELGRKLVKGEASWADVERAARKARK
jgi:hypothetical protein